MFAIIRNSSYLSTDDCSISDYSEDELIFPNFSSLSSSLVEGIFAYRVNCSGTVVSLAAYGLCPYPNNGTVVLHLLLRTSFSGDDVEHYFIAAECNKSEVFPGASYTQGYVISQNLNFTFPHGGGYIAVNRMRGCTMEKCLFLVAAKSKTTDIVRFVGGKFERANFSLQLSANVIPSAGKIIILATPK